MSTNFEQRRQELEARIARDRASLEQENTLLSHLPPQLAALDSMAHFHKLWDRAGSLHFNVCQYETLRRGPDPTMSDVLTCVEHFPAVDLAVYRDGCVSIRTLLDAVAARDRAQVRMVEGQETSDRYTPIGPFWVTFEAASHSNRMSIHYIGMTPIGLIEFRFGFNLWGAEARAIGQVSIMREHTKTIKNGRARIRSKSFDITRACAQLGNAKAEYLRRPNSDNETEPGAIELYYGSCDGEPAQVTLRDLATAMNVL